MNECTQEEYVANFHNLYAVVCSVEGCLYKDLCYCMSDIDNITPNTKTCEKFKGALNVKVR